MNDINNCSDDLIAYLLAEFHCASLRAKLAAHDLIAIGLALKGGLITPHQAVMHLEEADAFRFLGRLPGDDWGPGWTEDARQYHGDRKRSAPRSAA
jgi:hypothetical protein